MKNPKILYILIGVLCVLSIIAGIYAQFFIKEEERNNIIIPNLNIAGDDTITEKTAEEIKEQFTSLFTNVLNSGEYDTTNITRIVQDKDIIYSAYDINEKNDKYEIDVHLPVFNIKGEVPISYNNITQNVFANKVAQIMNNKNSDAIYQINYTAYINGDILSLVIEGTLKEGNNPQKVVVQTYNYNLTTGKKAELSEMLKNKNLIISEVQNKIYDTIEKEKEEAEVLVQSGYTVYNRDIQSSIYQIDNITNYFLGPNGNLYIIFAYGNQNYTSEMDIVFYE